MLVCLDGVLMGVDGDARMMLVVLVVVVALVVLEGKRNSGVWLLHGEIELGFVVWQNWNCGLVSG